VAQIQIVVGNEGITRIKALGKDQAERLASLKLMEKLLPAIERFDTIISEYLPEQEAGEAK